jgi:hypothetical protein
MGLAEIEIPEGLLKEFERIAKPGSRMFRTGLEIALERSKNKKDRIITSEELKKSLGI